MMRTLHLQIDDDFYEEFIKALPNDKVTVLDQDFIDNQNKFATELERFKNGSNGFKSHLENMKDLDGWLKEAEEDANS